MPLAWGPGGRHTLAEIRCKASGPVEAGQEFCGMLPQTAIATAADRRAGIQKKMYVPAPAEIVWRLALRGLALLNSEYLQDGLSVLYLVDDLWRWKIGIQR